MTSREFCYWLQGFFEINDAGLPDNVDQGLVSARIQVVKRHLALVFKHEIDPSQGTPAHQQELQTIHDGRPPASAHDGPLILRC